MKGLHLLLGLDARGRPRVHVELPDVFGRAGPIMPPGRGAGPGARRKAKHARATGAKTPADLSVRWYVVLSLRPIMTGVVPTVCLSTQLRSMRQRMGAVGRWVGQEMAKHGWGQW